MFDDAAAAWIAVLLALASAPFMARALAILPLGGAVARSVGLPLPTSRAGLIIAASVSTAVATLVVGPLSFIGFMAPHATRLIGLQLPLANLVGAMALGAGTMILADWAGRTAAFPWQIPTGLTGALIGGLYVTAMLISRRAQGR